MNNHHSLHVRMASLALAVLLLVVTVAPTVVASPEASSIPRVAGTDITDSAAVAAFFDRELPTNMERNNVRGGVLTAVHDGGVVLLREYSHADVGTIMSAPTRPSSTPAPLRKS
mgnify:FL=1